MKIGMKGMPNAYTSAHAIAGMQQTAQVYEPQDSPQSLEDFKKEIYAEISAIPRHHTQSGASTAINITDRAFEKMMADPAQKEEVLRLIKRELNGNYGPASPSYIVLNFDDDCVYSGSAAGSAYGSWFSGASSNSFWSSKPDSSTSIDKSAQRRREQQRLEEQKWQESLMSIRAWQEKLTEQAAMQGQAIDALLTQIDHTAALA